MQVARAWAQDQIILAQLKWEQRRQQRIEAGKVPMTRTPTKTFGGVLNATTPWSTDMDMNPYPFPHQPRDPLPTNLESPDPDVLTSSLQLRKPPRWWTTSKNCSTLQPPTVKMPARFRDTGSGDLTPQQQTRPPLPKGWQYEDEALEAGELKQEFPLDALCMATSAPLTRAETRRLRRELLSDPFRAHRRALKRM